MEDTRKKLRDIGAEVHDKLPSDVSEAIDDLKTRKKGTRRVGVELKRLNEEHVYVYEDEDVKLIIPVPRIDLFEAFVSELERLTPDIEDMKQYRAVLARAFWLLHQKPKPWERKWKVPRINDKKANDLLVKVLPRTDVVYNSLPKALFGLVEHVVGKKKVNPADTAE